MSAKEHYFAAAIDWDESQRQRLIDSNALKTKIAWASGIVAGLSVLSITFLLPLKQFVPITIRVDNLTGHYDTGAAGERLNMADQRNEKIMINDLARYIRAREGFTRGEAEFNYKTAYLMSCGRVRADWDNYFLPDNNPNSPVKTLTATDSERVDVQNVTFLPTDKDELRVAQVRFDKTVMHGTAQPMRTRYISTLTYEYDPANVPGEIKDLQFNAFGFCALNYRRDQEGAPVPVGQGNPAAAGPGTAGAPMSPLRVAPEPTAAAAGATAANLGGTPGAGQ